MKKVWFFFFLAAHKICQCVVFLQGVLKLSSFSHASIIKWGGWWFLHMQRNADLRADVWYSSVYPVPSCYSVPVLWSASISPTQTSGANWQIRMSSRKNNINSLPRSCFKNYTYGCFHCVFSFHTSISFFPSKASIFCFANIAQLWPLLFYLLMASTNNSPSM